MRRPLQRSRETRGQAMVEYSSINFFILLSLLAVLAVPLPRTPWFGGATNMVDAMFRAYQIYYDSFFYVLNLPFP